MQRLGIDLIRLGLKAATPKRGHEGAKAEKKTGSVSLLKNVALA